MKPTQARKASLVILVASVALLVATLTLPQIKTPQSSESVVPPIPGYTGYQIYGYGIPPVSEGSQVTVRLSGYTPGDVYLSLSPTEGNSVLPALPCGRPVTADYSCSVVVGGAYSLELSIIAYNGTGYTVTYSGTWALFDFLGVYFAPAVFLIIASLISAYYFGTRIPRQLNEESVEAELEAAGVNQGARMITSQVVGSVDIVHPRSWKN